MAGLQTPRPVHSPCALPSLAASFLNTGVLFLENVTFAKGNNVKKFIFCSNTNQESTVGHRARGSHSCPGSINSQGSPPPRSGDTAALGPGERPSKQPRVFLRGEFEGMFPKKYQGCQHPQVWDSASAELPAPGVQAATTASPNCPRNPNRVHLSGQSTQSSDIGEHRRPTYGPPLSGWPTHTAAALRPQPPLSGRGIVATPRDQEGNAASRKN